MKICTLVYSIARNYAYMCLYSNINELVALCDATYKHRIISNKIIIASFRIHTKEKRRNIDIIIIINTFEERRNKEKMA